MRGAVGGRRVSNFSLSHRGSESSFATSLKQVHTISTFFIYNLCTNSLIAFPYNLCRKLEIMLMKFDNDDCTVALSDRQRVYVHKKVQAYP